MWAHKTFKKFTSGMCMNFLFSIYSFYLSVLPPLSSNLPLTLLPPLSMCVLSLCFSFILPLTVHLIQPLALLQSCWEDVYSEKRDRFKNSRSTWGKRLGRGVVGWAEVGWKIVERRKCFRVNVDKRVCRVSWGSGEHRQLGQCASRGTGKWGFFYPQRERERELVLQRCAV